MNEMKENKAKWIVHTKRGPNNPNFEVCVIRSDNQHGQISFGWFDENKLYISSSGGPCLCSVTPAVWDGLVKLAETIAAQLNANE